jgi:L-ascorbate metabolism protein UlaG (beta-lactamase superfamily)
VFPEARRDEAPAGATHILLSHGHGDHAGNALALAQELAIPVVGSADLIGRWAARHGISGTGFNKDGTGNLNGARVTMVNASHSSSVEGPDGPVHAGSEAGFMIAGEGHVIHSSGDTGIMADMAWMAEMHAPDIGLLAAGGHYTMEMERAACAARKYFSFRTRLPIDCRTFPLPEQTAEALRRGLPPGIRVEEPQVPAPILF